MSTVRKIEGFADIYGPNENIAADFYMSKEFAGDTSHPAVLLVSEDGQHPRVWTEEEVKAIIRRMKPLIHDRGWAKDAYRKIATEVGITDL